MKQLLFTIVLIAFVGMMILGVAGGMSDKIHLPTVDTAVQSVGNWVTADTCTVYTYQNGTQETICK